jgi:hypothetical protein
MTRRSPVWSWWYEPWQGQGQGQADRAQA